MPGLRARKKQATAAALQRAAVELFLSRGYDETTVQDITDAAGVSQRTFFRYFATKDAVLMSEHSRREQEMARMLAARPEDEPIGALAQAAVEHLAADVEERRQLVTAQAQVASTVPSLADRFSGHHDRLVTLLADHVATRLGVDAAADPRPRLLAGQVVRSWTTSILLWLTGGAGRDLRALASEALTVARTDPALVDA